MRARSETDRRGGTRFWLWLAVIVGVALVVRLLHLYWLRRQGTFLIGDSFLYHRESILVADGLGWIRPEIYDAFGLRVEAALHPPGYPAWLAIWSWWGFDSVLANQLATVPIGLATVCTCGLIGRQVWTPMAGLVAAAIAAVHPAFFGWEGMVIQEPLAMFAGTLVVLAFIRLLRRPDGWSIVLAGLAAGFAPLTRAELGVTVAIAAVVVLLAHRSWRVVRSMVAVTVVAIAVVAPWSIHNTIRFGQFVPISNGFGTTLTSTHCDELRNEIVGYWSFRCQTAAREAVLDEWMAEHPDATPLAPGRTATLQIEGYPAFDVEGDQIYADLDDATFDALLAEYAVDYVREHPGYLVRSIPARIGRVLGVYRPIQQIRLDELVDGRQREIAVAAWAGYYVLLPVTIVGAVALWRRRRAELLLLATPLIGALAAVTVTFGNTRYRAIAEPSIAVAAAIGLVVVATWLRTTWSGPDVDHSPISDDAGDWDGAVGASPAGSPAAADPRSSVSTR